MLCRLRRTSALHAVRPVLVGVLGLPGARPMPRNGGARRWDPWRWGFVSRSSTLAQKQAPSGILDLNIAAGQLDVQVRALYFAFSVTLGLASRVQGLGQLVMCRM